MYASQNASHTMLKVNQLFYSPHNAKGTDNADFASKQSSNEDRKQHRHRWENRSEF